MLAKLICWLWGRHNNFVIVSNSLRTVYRCRRCGHYTIYKDQKYYIPMFGGNKSEALTVNIPFIELEYS